MIKNRNNKKYMKITSLILLAFIFINTNLVVAESMVNKSETVYVDLEDNGSVGEIISSIWLNSDRDLKNIEDKTSLKDIVNIKGEEVPEIKGEKVIWNTDKKDIYYQGKSEEKLPVDLHIEYFLDGSRVNPEDIVGESGKLRIEVEFINKDKEVVSLKNSKKKEIYKPLLVASIVNLPSENFEDIKVDGGKLITDASSDIVSYITMPGMKDNLEIDGDFSLDEKLVIEATTKDFEMKPIVSIMTPKIPEIEVFEDMEDIGDLKEGLSKIEEASNMLLEASEKLYKGQVDFNSGLEEFVEGVDKLSLGSSKLLEGSNDLADGINSAHQGSIKIDEASQKLSDSAEELGHGYLTLGSGMGQFGEKSMEFSKGANQVAQGVGSLPENLNALNEGMDSLIDGTNEIIAGQNQLNTGLNQSVEAIEEIRSAKTREKEVIEKLIGALDLLDAIAEGVDKLPGGQILADKILEFSSSQKVGLEGINGSSDQLLLALGQVEEGLRSAESGSKDLSQALEEVNLGQNNLSNGLGQMQDASQELKGASQELMAGSQALMDGSQSIKENSEKLNMGSQKFSAGTKELAKGTGNLSQGLYSLNDGGKMLNLGIMELVKGSGELNSNSGLLLDGSKQLVEGNKALNEAMFKFNEEGINRIISELENSKLDIDSILEIKDILVDMSKNNNSFSGIGEQMQGDLKYIMKTKSIRKEEESKKEDISSQEDGEDFKSWFKDKVNK